MDEVDVLIVGCGVIGLAVAAEVSGRGRKVLALERNASFGEETSSRNSEVIHAGIYYPEKTLKARFCVEGKHLIYALSEKYGIPTKRLGKLIVAAEPAEEAYLEKLRKQGEKNGVDDLKIISQAELKRLEPNVSGVAALHSPSTGIIDAHRFMQFFLAEAQSKNTDVAFRAPVTGIQKNGKGYRVTVGASAEESFSLHARVVINAAGLNSDLVAELAGMRIDESGYRIKFCKGEYFRLYGAAARSVTRLVYPVPNQVSLGLHLTPDMEGGLRLGPSAHYVDRKTANYDIDESLRASFADEVKKILPSVDADRLMPDTAGIRPKLQGPGEPFRDFVIQEESARGFPDFINLIGIDSPGLTSSPAIARHVARLVDNALSV